MRSIAHFSQFCAAALCLSYALAAAESPTQFKVSEFTFTRPAQWQWVETHSTMRKAQLRVPGDNGGGEVVFYYFGEGQGGNTQANVDRWLGQFQEGRNKINAKVESKVIGKTKVTYVQGEGTYLSGMPGGPTTPMKNYALLGAVMESADGNVFVRFTGPSALVKKASADFRKMIESGLK